MGLPGWLGSLGEDDECLFLMSVDARRIKVDSSSE